MALILLTAFTGFETGNKYKILNAQGQSIYLAAEDTDCCTRNMCGPFRPFGMKIMDNGSNEVIHANRPLACDCCLFPCSRQVCVVFEKKNCFLFFQTMFFILEFFFFFFKQNMFFFFSRKH